MPGNNNAGAMRAWLRECPALARERAFGADYLAEGESYSLDAVPSALRYRENILGETALRERQEQRFLLSSREPYGPDPARNLENLGVLQDVAAWIAARNAARSFPDWEGGEVVAVVPTVSAAPVSRGSAFARYEMEIKVIYRHQAIGIRH